MRHLATIQEITNIQPIEGADNIEVATINHGWKVVINKNIHTVGEKVVYFEIDSLLPPTEWNEFLSKGNGLKTTVLEGKEYTGYRLKTIRLRGTTSQGLVMPMSILPEGKYEPGQDVSDVLGVVKYEAPIPAELAGDIEGPLPSFLVKTDEERCLSEDTLITTKDGDKTIREICESKYKGKVLSYNIEKDTEEFNNVDDWLIRKNNNDWYEIELESGSKLKATGNHRIWLPVLGCYRNVKDLSTDDFVLKTE